MGKETRYRKLIREMRSILDGETDPIVWMSTLSCLIKQEMGFLWVGFYRVVDGELRIGPYQGTLGCLRIAFGRGVCGACARQKETIIVPDVHKFPGHIACDARSNSEIVVPVFDREGLLRAILDIDSDEYGSFDQVDRKYLERMAGAMRDLPWKKLS